MVLRKTARVTAVTVTVALTVFIGVAQQRRTGDEPLTPDQIGVLQTRDVSNPQTQITDTDGATLLPKTIDLSIHRNANSQIDWELQFKNQGELQSCQSVAVSYAADILQRNSYFGASYNRSYDKGFIWEILRHGDYMSAEPSCQENCSKCGGFNVLRAAQAASPGILYEDEAYEPSCGRNTITIPLTGHPRYTFTYIWAKASKYLNPDVILNNLSQRSWTSVRRSMKEYLAAEIPLLISIYPAPDDNLGFDKIYANGGDSYSHLLDDNSFDGESSGWHAMTVVGYDDTRNGGSFKIANSWLRLNSDEKWGENGYLWITYPAFQRITRLVIAFQIDPDQSDFAMALTPNTSDGLGVFSMLSADAYAVASGNKAAMASFRIRLVERANHGVTSVCLDANTPYWVERNHNEVIMYKCGRQENQKWRVTLREQRGAVKYYTLESLGQDTKGKVLAIKEGRLALVQKSAEFNRNQLWVFRNAPGKPSLTRSFAIVWAGNDGAFVLQGDRLRLEQYSDLNASEPLALNAFNNLDRQKWIFEVQH